MNTKPQSLTNLAAGIAFAALLALAQPAKAALIPKADNASALNAGASWTGGTAPGAADIAVWNSTVQVNTNDDPLGAALSWAGIQITNPGGPVAIPADANTLTLGASGINMFGASEGLTMSNNVAVSTPQYWSVGNGQTLDLEGVLTRSAGSALMFSFDTNLLDQVILDPTITGTIIASSAGTLLLPSAIGGGTSSGTPFATYNDVEFAGLNSSYQVVGASTLGLYTANPSGTAPTLGNLAGVYDFNNTNSLGGRVASTLGINGFRFNTPQLINSSPSTYTYNGVGSWEILFKASNTLDVDSILMTTNLGNSYVVFTPAGSSVMRIANAQNELLVFQNNPASSLVWQVPITQRNGNSTVSKMGVGTMEIQTSCSYSGGTQIHGGTLLVDGAGYAGTGTITVYSNANFEGQSAGTNASVVNVLNGGAHSVLLTAANGQFVDRANVTFNPGTTWLQFIYSNTIVPSATVPALYVSNATLYASNTVNINVLCSSLSVGQFPLVKYTTLVTNSAAGFPFVLAGIQPHIGAYLSNNVASQSVDLVVTNASAQPLRWATGSGNWDIGISPNWLDGNGNTDTYLQYLSLADNVLFSDAGAGPSPVVVTLNTNVAPGAMTVNNSAVNYTITGKGSIGGSIAVTKSGTGTLVLATTNTFSSGLNLNGGILNFSTLNNLGSGAINFNGGTLQYNGNTDDISTRTVTFGSGGATIDTAGQSVNYAGVVGGSGAGGLTKAGAGTLTLNGTNKYAGTTFILAGTLALGTSTYISNSPAIIVNSGAVLDAATSGVGLTLSSPAAQVLSGYGTVNGEIVAPSGTTITPATNGLFGTLSFANDLTVSGGTLNVDVSATNKDLLAVATNLTLSSGTLQVNVVGSLTNGVYRIIAYGGSLLSGAGSSANLNLTGFSQSGQVATLSDAIAGEIDLVVGTGAHDPIVWSGTGNSWDLAGTTDWYYGGTTTPWAFTNDDTVRLDDSGGGSSTVTLNATVLPTAVIVSNNAETYTLVDGTGVGGGRIAGPASFVKDGANTCINATASGYSGPTTIINGTLQIGNGGIGDIGTGSVTNNGALVFDQSDLNTHYVPGSISGTGSVTVEGVSPIVLSANNSYAGPTTVAAGVLQVGNDGATGSLGAGPVTNNGTLLFSRTGSVTLNNNITGTGPVAFLGAATVLYGGVNSYQNNTYISNGIVKLNTSTAVYSDGGSGDWLILDGNPGTQAGALDLNGHSVSVNALSGIYVGGGANGLIDNNGGTGTNTLSIVGNATTTYGGIIEDNGGTGGKLALVINGGASQTIDVETSTGNTFSGGTVISNSTVTLTQGSQAGYALTVALGAGPVTLYNSSLYAVGGTGSTSPSYNSLANNIFIPAGFSATLYGPQRGTMEANILGGGSLTYITSYVRDVINGNWSGFTGQITVGETTSGGNWGVATTNGFGHLFLTNSSGTSGVNMYNQVAGTPTIPIGELADDGSGTISGAESGNNNGAAAALFAIGGLNTSTNYGGGILDNVGIIKVGTGSWTLTGETLTYSNLTTISNGVLVLGTNVANANTATLPNTSPITIASPGVLDVSMEGTLTLGAGLYPQILQGNGTLNGSLLVDAGSTVMPGATNTTAILTVTNAVDVEGTLNVNFDRTNAITSSKLAAGGAIVVNGTINVTNLGPDLITGDIYHLFNHAITGAWTLNLPAQNAAATITYSYQTNLATDGTIKVLAGAVGVNTNPTNITTQVSGNVLTLSWPADHTGWRLLVQTNNLALGVSASTNDWGTVTGSSATNSVSLTNNPSLPDEFYRLVYP